MELQPDQQPLLWDSYVSAYERVFEPLTSEFASRALDSLRLNPGDRLIDVAAGSGGASLLGLQRGLDVLAVDASQAMVGRIAERSGSLSVGPSSLRVAVMDGMALALPDCLFDAAISVFGVILFPNAELGARELARVVRPGGRLALVTWTEMERYELATRLQAAVTQVCGPQPPAPSLPAQLRFQDTSVFRALLSQAGLVVEALVRMQARWRLPSARWLADHIEFAPGMAAMTSRLASNRKSILESFVTALERDQGHAAVELSAVAHAAVAFKPRAK